MAKLTRSQIVLKQTQDEHICDKNEGGGEYRDDEHNDSLRVKDFYDVYSNSCKTLSEMPVTKKKAYCSILRELKGLENSNNIVRVFDVGCGNGNFIKLFNEISSVSLYGIDYSEKQLGYAKENVNNVEFKQVDLNRGIPFEADFFDVIYCSEVIEHLYDPDYLLEEMHRVAKNGALLILTTPNLNSWLSRIMVMFGACPMFYEASTVNSRHGYGIFKNIKRQTYPVGHVRLLNLDALSGILVGNGFDDIKASGESCGLFGGVVGIVDRFMSKIPTLSTDLYIECRVRKEAVQNEHECTINNNPCA